MPPRHTGPCKRQRPHARFWTEEALEAFSVVAFIVILGGLAAFVFTH